MKLKMTHYINCCSHEQPLKMGLKCFTSSIVRMPAICTDVLFAPPTHRECSATCVLKNDTKRQAYKGDEALHVTVVPSRLQHILWGTYPMTLHDIIVVHLRFAA